jgi:hypothetical protein
MKVEARTSRSDRSPSDWVQPVCLDREIRGGAWRARWRRRSAANRAVRFRLCLTRRHRPRRYWLARQGCLPALSGSLATIGASDRAALSRWGRTHDYSNKYRHEDARSNDRIGHCNGLLHGGRRLWSGCDRNPVSATAGVRGMRRQRTGRRLCDDLWLRRSGGASLGPPWAARRRSHSGDDHSHRTAVAGVTQGSQHGIEGLLVGQLAVACPPELGTRSTRTPTLRQCQRIRGGRPHARRCRPAPQVNAGHVNHGDTQPSASSQHCRTKFHGSMAPQLPERRAASPLLQLG